MTKKRSTGKKPRKCRPPLSQGTPTLPVLGRIDGRTMAALAFRKALDDFVGDLGGEENITRAELEIARRSAGIRRTVRVSLPGRLGTVPESGDLEEGRQRTLGHTGAYLRAAATYDATVPGELTP